MIRKIDRYQFGALISLAFASFVAHAGTIPDLLINAIEPGIEQAGLGMGWLDSETLAVSAPLKTEPSYRPTSDERVLLVNVVTGAIQEAVNPGSVKCVDVAAGLVIVEVGSKQRRYYPNSTAPLPEIKAYRWSTASKESLNKPPQNSAAN
jgi:hypothetical protein